MIALMDWLSGAWNAECDSESDETLHKRPGVILPTLPSDLRNHLR
jgi:hypothetical protein